MENSILFYYWTRSSDINTVLKIVLRRRLRYSVNSTTLKHLGAYLAPFGVSIRSGTSLERFCSRGVTLRTATDEHGHASWSSKAVTRWRSTLTLLVLTLQPAYLLIAFNISIVVNKYMCSTLLQYSLLTFLF